MTGRIPRRILSAVLVIGLVFLIAAGLSACRSSTMETYYEQRENYISVSGTVSHISFDEESCALYIEFSDLVPSLDDTRFKVVGEHVGLLREKAGDPAIKIGDRAEFVTAPKYFGDGYVMPIVALTVEGSVLLEFEEGLDNFLDWLRQ